MKNKILLQANFKRHKGSLIGLFLIMLMVSLTLVSVVTIWNNSNVYLKAEMERMNYGDITAWTHSISDEQALYSDIEQLSDVESVSVQSLIYADYEANNQHSDSEGQLVIYDPEHFPYRIFNDENNGYISEKIDITTGEIYISATLLSTFDIEVGDSITFPIDRKGNVKTFEIKGVFEDPFMGSSMIGMKSFLIGQEDYEDMKVIIDNSGIDALARTGKMIHIKQSSQSLLNNAQFNQLLNEQTSLSDYVDFVHSKEAILGFMLILQNAFTGLSLAFALILLIISFLIVSYSISAMIDQDQMNMAILKTMGYDGSKLRSLLKQQYLMVIGLGAICGILLSLAIVPFTSKVMSSFSGILTPSTPLIYLWVILSILLIVFYSLFIHYKTKRINTIPPINMIQGVISNEQKAVRIPLKKNFLTLRISLRQLMSGRKRYVSVCISAILLVFITSMIGRMNFWLGVDGKGLMDAFNPADLDIGVQMVGNQNVEEMEALIKQYSFIIDSYELAMPNVSVNGIDLTANVISEPERFHILQGRTIQQPNEIVITETVAADMTLNINDTVTLASNDKSDSYTVVGIYQCANDMGGNIGMNREGFLLIGDETQNMWCHHYFLEEPKEKPTIINALNEEYGGDVYIHENTWPGLFSILAAMRMLLVVMMGMSTLFILIVTSMTGNKIFLFEKRNLSIYKAIGFTSTQLRFTFAIRYGLIAAIGSVAGIIISSISTDSIVGSLMKFAGISNFASHPDGISILLPGIIISLLFACFAYLTSGKIARLDMNELVSE